MSGSDGKDVGALLKRLRGEYGQSSPVDATPVLPPIDVAEPILGEFLRAFLSWECTGSRAQIALKRIEDSVVDFNELRICLPDELIRLMGERYPRVEERALRVRASLNDLYVRQHSVTLEHLRDLPTKDARGFLESLDGVPRYVSSRVLLICLGGHAAPVDGRICRRLVEAKLVDDAATPEVAASMLEKKTRPDDLPDLYRLLQAWADDAPVTAAESTAESHGRNGKRETKANSTAAGAEGSRKKPRSAAGSGKEKATSKKKADS